MKQKLAILLALLLMMTGIMAGCGGGGGEENPAGEESGTPLKVGFIYVGPVADGGFTGAHDAGRVYLDQQLAGQVETMIQENVEETNEAVISAAKNMIDQGASIIFTTSFGFMDATEQLAGEFPDVKFMHFSGSKMNDTNFGNYFGAMEEPRYLSGIVAGMKTESNKIGYVAAFPYTELLIGINAFTLGAQSVNPDVEVSVVWTNSWYDPAKEKDAAKALLDQGCDVIAQHCDTTGPQTAAEEKGAWAIGYNGDTGNVVPNAFMTAPVWNHGIFYAEQVQKVLDGTWAPESYYGTISDGYVDLLPLTDIAPADAKEKVDEKKAAFTAGEPVFVGPIFDQAGNKVVEDGKALDRGEIWQIDYLVKGVKGTLE